MEYIIRKVINALTAEQFNEIKAAVKSSAAYDSDNPPLTQKELKEFKRVDPEHQNTKE
ncbi:hypothetical protein bpr_II187 (plasmid) [Butyrivibrio proteoclasticus B316]|uniref:Uncharacterized protein n=1 Tax=Butyrivibrio proteoclasticus (strain ATCC 51982 / DSM 14932 / B316) TaxID=515622 RepID=E0S3Z3_BUTPB|nr:hypothetical protein [Butyrivibrio proteoclasticus]ADL36125.1 hypothetical protein bpr_II187 [Butyrivibrio proteoclasticus B316]